MCVKLTHYFSKQTFHPTIRGIKFWIAHDRTCPPLGTSESSHLHLFLPKTDFDIDYLSDNEPKIQFVHSQQVQYTTNDTDNGGIRNVNKANVNDDNNAGLVQGDFAKNDQFENIDDDQINSDEV